MVFTDNDIIQGLKNVRRNQTLHKDRGLHITAFKGPPVANDYVYNVLDVLDKVAKETGKSIPQIALNWLLQRPTVASVIIGARNEKQLKQNLGAFGWQLSEEHMEMLDRVSQQTPSYPYWHQQGFRRNPPSVKLY